MTKYEYEYYSDFQKGPNTTTNIIRFSKNDRIRIFLDIPKIPSGEKSNKNKQRKNALPPEAHQRTHQKRYSGEKSNKCNQCYFASSNADHLKRHLKTHSGKKSNKCHHCDYASSDASNLRVHLKTHSGKKSNKCSQCDYKSNIKNIT